MKTINTILTIGLLFFFVGIVNNAHAASGISFQCNKGFGISILHGDHFAIPKLEEAKYSGVFHFNIMSNGDGATVEYRRDGGGGRVDTLTLNDGFDDPNIHMQYFYAHTSYNLFSVDVYTFQQKEAVFLLTMTSSRTQIVNGITISSSTVYTMPCSGKIIQ